MIRNSPVFVLLAIAAANVGNYADLDLWLHIVIGNLTLATHHVPNVDFFSYTVAGHPVGDHEWLAEVLFALLWRSLGTLGLRLFKLVCVAVMVVALAFALESTGASLRVQRAVLLLCSVSLAMLIHLRPELLTMAFLAVEIAMLSFETYEGGATLWPIVLFFPVWANVHAGFMAGLGALGVFAAVTLVKDVALGAGIRRGMELAGLTVACVLATLVNPIGIGIWPALLTAVSSPALHQSLAEWTPLWSRIAFDLHGSPLQVLLFVLPLGLIGATAVSLFLRRTILDLPLVAVAAIFSAAAFKASRHLPLALIVLAAPLAYHLCSGRESADVEADDSEHGPRTIIIGALALALLIFGHGFSSAPLPADPPCPAGAVAFMKEHDLHGNILNDYLWGNYLIWHVWPRSKVFIDGRLQFAYPNRFLQRYFAFYKGDPREKSLPDDYPTTNLVLLSPSSGGFRLVTSDPKWKLIYRDGVSALFVRSTSSTALQFPHPVIAKAPLSLFP